MKFVAAVEYIGTNYSGWQRQHHAPSVQENVEKALSQVANTPIAVTCAGRTDAGVHARGQVIHFETDASRDSSSWLLGCNALMPPDISLRWVQPASDEFHARFSALHRCYRYIIYDQPARSALLYGRANWSRYSLDTDLMHQAGQCLIGEHDFSAFRAAECQSKTAMRNLMQLSVKRVGGLIMLDVQANAFLHHMVRNIAGSLIAVGAKREPVEWVESVLNQRDRRLAGITAASAGLYFMSVAYPERFNLPIMETTEILSYD